MQNLNHSKNKSAASARAAERMRAHRERRKQGLRCLTVELRETEIDALISKGLLTTEKRNNTSAVADALYEYLEATLNSSA